MTRGTSKAIIAAGRRLATLVLPALWLAAAGCESTQRQASQASLERWSQVRAQVKAKLASDQLAAGNVEDAAAEVAEAVRLDPTNSELLTLQARVYLARGDHHAARRLLETTDVEGPLRAEINYLLGIIQQQCLHWDEAFNHFVRAANEDPHEVAYIVAIVQNMLQLGEAEEALTFLHSYQDEFGWTSAYHAAVAECCEQLDDWSGAATAWEKVADAHDFPSMRERLALALYRCGRSREAIAHLQRLLDEASVEPLEPLRLALAQCLIEVGQSAAAREQLSRLLREDPQDVAALQLLACAFAQEGTLDRARRLAEQALRIEPDNLRAMELVAALALRTGDQTRALVLSERILKLTPEVNSPIAQEIARQLAASPNTEN